MRFIFLISLIALASTNAFSQGDPELTKILAMIDSPIDTVEVGGYNELCWHLKYSNPDSAIAVGNIGLKKAKAIGYDQGIGTAYGNIGIVYWGIGNYDSALAYITNSQVVYKRMNFDKGIMAALVNMGLLKQTIGKLPESVEDLLQALKLQEKLEFTAYRPPIIHNLGNAYYLMEDFENAKKYYLESYRLKAADDPSLFSTEMNLGVAYQKLGNPDSAMYYYYKALPQAKKQSAWGTLHKLNLNIGTIHAEQNRYSKALNYYSEAEKLLQKVNNDLDGTILLVRISEAYMFLENYSQAKSYAQKSLELSNKLVNNIRIQAAYMQLYKVAKAQNDYGSSLLYFENYIQYRDSIYNLEKHNAIAELQIQYETEKKEQENRILKAEASIQALQIAQNEKVIIGIVVLSIFLMLLVILYNSRRHYKLKAQIAEAKEQQQKIRFQAVIEAEEKERIRIARELHDGVGQQLTGIKMAFESIIEEFKSKDSTFSDKLKNLTTYLYQSSDEIRNISHQMMPKSLMDLGLKSAIHDLLDKAFKYSSIKVSFDHFNVATRFADNIEITVYRVAQELINNILKHSGASEVSVQLFADKNNLRLLVEDNGKGFTSSDIEGHGIYSMKNRLELTQGKIYFENGPESGTVASVTVPIQN